MVLGRKAAPREATALDTYLVTVCDHGMNASTFTTRVVASTQADLFAAVTAGYCALTGPLHGGAPEPVLEMLDAIGTRERIKPWVDDALARGERLMGFGHRVYRVRDPRADVLKAAIERLAAGGADLPFAGEVEAYIREALRRKNPDRPLETNVEFFTAILLDALAIPRQAFTPIFAVARAAGWTAHAREQQRTGRLIRPSSSYVGPVPGASRGVEAMPPQPASSLRMREHRTAIISARRPEFPADGAAARRDDENTGLGLAHHGLQIIIRLDDLDQAVLGGAVAAIGVGVVLLHQRLVLRLDVVERRFAPKSHHLQRLALGVHHLARLGLGLRAAPDPAASCPAVELGEHAERIGRAVEIVLDAALAFLPPLLAPIFQVGRWPVSASFW